jgi:2',3'-cyclic-nucleotide 2'-phosphodiesterase (5'-nucleotidase family)
MRVKKFDDIEIYQDAFEIQRIGNEAVRRALKENKEKGIPIVFSRNGVIYYELPSGEITTQNPFEK